MDDYISRDEARKAFLKALSKNSDREKSAIDWHNCKVILGSIPAADVRPVVRGEWEPNVRHDDCLVCTKCGCGYPAVGYAWMDCNRRSDERESACFITDIMNFCPNCGADMRPREDGNDQTDAD